MTSQQATVLRAFKTAPGRKLTTSQLAGLHVVRYSARMMELRDEHGFSFVKKRLPGGGRQYEYKLVGEPADVERDSSGAPLDHGAPSSGAAVSLSAGTRRPPNPYEYELGEVA